METNTIVRAIELILTERFKMPWCIKFEFGASSQDAVWGAKVTVVGAPETDAVVTYAGAGAALHESVNDLFRKVVNKLPDGYEAGLG